MRARRSPADQQRVYAEQEAHARGIALTWQRAMIFHCECQAVGEEARPSQISRLRARAIELFEPKDYVYPLRAAAMIGVDLELTVHTNQAHTHT